MGWLALRSLRSKLVLFALLLVTVPGIVLSLLADEAARAALEQSVGRQLAQIGGDALVEIAQAIADARAEVTAWAQLDVMRDVVIGDLDKRLSRFLNTIGEGDAPYLELYAVDRAGRVVAASAPELLLLDGPAPRRIVATPRVGVESAGPRWAARRWRFAVAGSEWVSGARGR